ncbi:class I adenylate-forming enzyme family protein [Nonomuraea soli]|uniref:Acyl-coenzyme A synthetase/AMP-(Fatty) acid ligase n=1 Tax=Nonomuraea soli TaxID=1032476 RepID=A0A7W0CD62_9ACTN|nr:AMP-binding protein [Nonomuraea soli]MBA2888827.1 acyl-coenzyme A synthetase/AMP-(fatty) acid ligase [Nonomuraea soli]
MLRLLAGEAARRFGARAAVVSGSSCLSFADLDTLSDRLAAGLAHRGVRIGDVVALALPEGPDWVLAYVAAAKIGAVTAGAGHPDPAIVLSTLERLGRREAPPPPFPPGPERPVVVVYTSRHRCGVVFGDKQLEAIRAHGAGTRWGTGDARMVFTRLDHLAFATRLPVFLQTGRTSHLLPRWDPEAAARLVRDHRLPVLQGSPRQLAQVMETGARLPEVRLVLSSGAPAGPGLIRKLRERYGVPVCNRYLCTEAGLGLGTRPDDPPDDAERTVGRPRAGVDVSIRDPNGRILARGEVGAVLLRSRAVMSGYVETARNVRVFARDGFVRTGDRGYIDGTGRLTLADPHVGA